MEKVGKYWKKEIIIENATRLHYIISAVNSNGIWNNTGEKIVTIIDNDKPQIINIEAYPKVQKIGGYINISCLVIDKRPST